MFRIIKKKETKIELYGTTFTINNEYFKLSNFKFASVDSYGDLKIFSEEPDLIESLWIRKPRSQELLIDNVKFEGDYKESLITFGEDNDHCRKE